MVESQTDIRMPKIREEKEGLKFWKHESEKESFTKITKNTNQPLIAQPQRI